MQLEFNVEKQSLERLDNDKVVNLSENYLRLKFQFSDDWDEFVKYILFKVDKQTYRLKLDEADSVLLPAGLLCGDKLIFSLYGLTGESDQDFVRITTNRLRVDLLESGFTHDVEPDIPVSEMDIVEEIYNAIELTRKECEEYTDTGLLGKADFIHFHSQADILDFNHTHLEEDITDLRDYALKNEIPTKTSELLNDVPFLTTHQSLEDYYTKTEVDELIYNLNNELQLKADKNLIMIDETLDFKAKYKKDGFMQENTTIYFYKVI